MSISKDKSKELKIGLILNYAAIGIGLVGSLLLNPIIIKYLGQSEYGLYETIGALVNNLAILDLGFSSVIVRFTAKYELEGDLKRRDEFLYTARRIYQILAVIILALGAILFLFIDTIFGKSFTSVELEKAHILFLLALGTTAISIYGQIYIGALSGVEKFIIPRVIRIAKTIFGKLTCIAILMLGADSVGYTATLFLFEIIGFFVNNFYAKKAVGFSKCKIQLAEVKELLVFTGFLFIQAIAATLYWTVNKLILGALMGTAVVAVYSISLNLHNIVENVSVSVRDVLLPKATRFAVTDGGEKQIQSFMTKAGRLILMVYGLLFAGLIVVGEEFIYLWLGPDYLGAYGIFLVLGATSLLPSILTIGETVCRAFNKHQFLSYAYLVAAFINIAFTVVLVKFFGMYGAAVASGIGLVSVYTIVRLIYFKKTFDLHIFKYFKDTFSGIIWSLISTIVFGYVIKYFWTDYSWFSLVIQSCIMGGVFIITMLIFGLNKEEKNMFLNIMKAIKSKLIKKSNLSK